MWSPSGNNSHQLELGEAQLDSPDIVSNLSMTALWRRNDSGIDYPWWGKSIFIEGFPSQSASNRAKAKAYIWIRDWLSVV